MKRKVKIPVEVEKQGLFGKKKATPGWAGENVEAVLPKLVKNARQSQKRKDWRRRIWRTANLRSAWVFGIGFFDERVYILHFLKYIQLCSRRTICNFHCAAPDGLHCHSIQIFVFGRFGLHLDVWITWIIIKEAQGKSGVKINVDIFRRKIYNQYGGGNFALHF